jgi:CheY-like chemotaxis protein
MKILLASDALEAAALVQALAHAGDHEITHCADGARAIIDLLRNEYDWAIIDGRAVSGGERNIACLIRAMGADIQDKPAACSRSGDKAGGAAMRTSCGVEWTKDGVLQLHCGLHALLNNAPAPRQPDLGCVGEILFEYHAPCAKVRGAR